MFLAAATFSCTRNLIVDNNTWATCDSFRYTEYTFKNGWYYYYDGSLLNIDQYKFNNNKLIFYYSVGFVEYKVAILDENNIVLSRNDSIFVNLSKVDTKVSPVVANYNYDMNDSINKLYLKHFEQRAEAANCEPYDWPEFKHDLDTSFWLFDLDDDIEQYLDSLKNKSNN